VAAIPRRATSSLVQLGHFGPSSRIASRGSSIDLLNHLIRPLQERLGDGQPEGLGEALKHPNRGI
jgi:hypothetical protein